MRLLSFWRRPKPKHTEGTKARAKAEVELAKTKAETPQYAALAASLIEVQRTNHLGSSAARILRGER
jgi:hypothetical protein